MTLPFQAVCQQHVLLLTWGEDGRRNLMDDAWFDTLSAHLESAQADPQVRVVVLAGHGSDFSLGADLKSLTSGSFAQGYAQSSTARLARCLSTFEKPLVAAVQGSAIGGGCTVLLHCDFVYAADDARFHLPFARLGLVPEFGSSYLLALHAGPRLASELVLLAQPFGVDTALRAGLITHAVPAAQLQAQALSTAAALAALPPGPLRASKRLLQAAHQSALQAACAAEGQALEAAVVSPELQEAVQAFVAKRPADFSRFS